MLRRLGLSLVSASKFIMSTENRKFDAASTAAEVVANVDLKGRYAVVTGATGGLGAEAARALASAGADVTLTARTRDKAEPVVQKIRQESPDVNVDVIELELTSLGSTRDAAAKLLAGGRSVDMLVNNAGVMGCPLSHSEAGHEFQFAANHLGHFLFTCSIAPLLKANGGARVVSVSSAGHWFSPVEFDDINYERRDYDKWKSYGQSKTANSLFAVELDRRWSGDGVRAFAVHPGAIITDLGRHLQVEDTEILGDLEFKTVEAGAATHVYAATAPELDDQGGLYLEDCGIAADGSLDTPFVGWAPFASDVEAARKLWEASEDMVSTRFD